MGEALDVALRNLIDNDPQAIVRVNAARVYAHVARTGAPAHFKTITELLANPKTSTEIKYYMFHAAGAALNANHPIDMQRRKHAEEPKVVAALVKALEDCINKPAMLMPDYKADKVTTEQSQVIAMVRRQAVRALGNVKFVRIPGPDAQTPYLYPSYTLVRVAMSDPSLVPEPGPAECAEAVIGLCHMAPVEWKADNVEPITSFNADVAVEAMIRGLITFASPRASDQTDRTLPWRNYSLRIADAMVKYRPLFDPDFSINPNKFSPKFVPASFEEMTKFVFPKILFPLEDVDKDGKPKANPAVPQLRELLSTTEKNLRSKGKTLLFEGVKETTVLFPQAK
jgi:hypothetical protein